MSVKRIVVKITPVKVGANPLDVVEDILNKELRKLERSTGFYHTLVGWEIGYVNTAGNLDDPQRVIISTWQSSNRK